MSKPDAGAGITPFLLIAGDQQPAPFFDAAGEIAEDEEDTTWQPLSVVRGIPEGVSAVTVMGAMAPRQIMNEWTKDPREILETFAAEMRANQRHYSIYGGNYAIAQQIERRAAHAPQSGDQRAARLRGAGGPGRRPARDGGRRAGVADWRRQGA